jgi:hypothetical protein
LLVHIVEDWEIMEEYGTEPQTIYQILAAEEEKTVVNVIAGRIGFQKTFDNPADPLINRIIKFCKSQNYVKFSQDVNADQFFK